GAATVRALRAEGALVAGGARRVGEIEADFALELDVTDAASCAAFVDAAVGALGRLDILVNNAGLSLGREPFAESTEEDERKVRFRGDEAKARAVYETVGLGGPIHAEDVADCIAFAVTRAPHVNVDEIVVMALAQSSGTRIVRE